LSAGLRRSVKVKRRTIEIFAPEDERIEQIQGRLSDDELARRGQRVLLDAQEALDPRDLRETVIKRLRREYNEHQGLDLPEADVERAFHLILAAYPRLLTQALRACAARHKEAVQAESLPLQTMAPPATARSRLNLYAVLPPDLNSHERAFAELLDADLSGTVRWWHRNPPRKPWSVGLVMSSGQRFFPDFILGLSDQAGGERVRLLETKGGHILDSDETLEKLQAEHQTYGRPIMLKRKDDGTFWVIKYSQQREKAEEDRIFRVEYLEQY
jgi:type III restriction enzyme